MARPRLGEPDRQHREKTASHPGQGADHEKQGEKATPQILESRNPRGLDLRHAALQVPVKVKQRLYLSRIV